ncbi:MAG TPA: hypothetical protein VM686_19235 [Polyangiaceae bacterium]|nr:hypothetical protein [Polyangiaceae bacterium]
MDDDFLIAIRSGGPPTLLMFLVVPVLVVVLASGFGSVSGLVSGKAAADTAGLIVVLTFTPLAVVGPLTFHFWRKHQRFLHILRNGHRVWGEALLAERGLGYLRRSGIKHSGRFVKGTVQVRVRQADGSFHVGTCKGWYRLAELEALARGAPAPVIYLPGVPDVIVAGCMPAG